ncbi:MULTISPECIES: LysM peptidoglycan-binding domain-containing protein [unclassified Anabaena]|uniref:LysM peptidoglycan-binding domain-containing protein n=1 Tax=unclassified Anabaena TaxID=2619674 RepID=UPI000832BEC2|nr:MULTISPECIES: LysM domain-containing protein [unclassified Anabaena]
MKINLNCPVCSYQGITGDICPNCDADLSLIRMLQELPQQQTRAVFSWKIILLMLLIGLGLGLGTSMIFSQPQLNTVVVSHPIPIERTKTTPPVVVKPQPPPAPTTYTVKPGEHLSAIAEKFCGKNTSWQIMVKANPQLQGREDYINVGEVLKIPNCQEGI